ncbi:MAG: hypothetical protein II956_07370 [Bacteroidales bacterium]|nr:hypothetical protein [Bacteroidales bacterium]
MEKILIASSPKGKETAQKLFQTLKKNGYSVNNNAAKIDRNALPDLLIAVITDDSENNPTMMSILHSCSEYGVTVVPFVTVDMENKTVSQNYFLDEHDWIDASTVNFSEGQATLLDMLKNNYQYLSKRIEKKQPQKTIVNTTATNTKKNTTTNNASSGKEQLFKNLLYMSAAVIVVLLFILVNGGLKQTNREADNYRANAASSSDNNNNGLNSSGVKIQLSQQLKNSEQNFVGRWKITDYSDNQFRRTRQDSLDLQALVNALLTRAELVFRADKTFTRTGFSENPETGAWEYDPQSKYLKLQPTNGNQYDVVQIQEITQNRLIIVVQEKMDNNDIFTKITFQKQ